MYQEHLKDWRLISTAKIYLVIRERWKSEQNEKLRSNDKFAGEWKVFYKCDPVGGSGSTPLD